MRRLSGFVILLASVAAAGCATAMNVSSHRDRGLDFTRYHTYDWGPADALPTGDERLDRDPFFQDHFQGAVDRGLQLKGIARAEGTPPDLLVHYHASVNRRFDVNRLDRQYGYCGNGGCPDVPVEYEAGTFVIDIVDARTNRLVWRGWAQDSIEPVLQNRDVMSSRIDQAVTRMLARFPGAF